ncbi:MAG: hypothetical protein HQ582_18200 [Planctomycetes bacterium]|nr:hypothetical protein [Planctomycetota bacterium]
MSVLGMGRTEAMWYTPIVTLMRLQMAYQERQGHEQEWAPSKTQQIADRMDELEAKYGNADTTRTGDTG